MTQSQFEQELALQPIAENHFSLHIADHWTISDTINGGFLMALAAKAALQDNQDHPDPLAVSGHYTGPALVGEVQVRTQYLAGSRSTSVVSVRVEQNDALCCQFMVTGTNLSMASGMDCELRTAPELAPASECTPAGEPATPGPMSKRVTLLYAPPQRFWLPERQGSGSYECWAGHTDGADANALALLLFADAVPPAVFTLMHEPSWVPTIALGVQIRGRPAPGMLRLRVQTHSVSDGFAEEDVELWDSNNRLVALSRQLLKLRKAS